MAPGFWRSALFWARRTMSFLEWSDPVATFFIWELCWSILSLFLGVSPSSPGQGYKKFPSKPQQDAWTRKESYYWDIIYLGSNWEMLYLARTLYCLWVVVSVVVWQSNDKSDTRALDYDKIPWDTKHTICITRQTTYSHDWLGISLERKHRKKDLSPLSIAYLKQRENFYEWGPSVGWP